MWRVLFLEEEKGSVEDKYEYYKSAKSVGLLASRHSLAFD